jgi:hypothetical protein
LLQLQKKYKINNVFLVNLFNMEKEMANNAANFEAKVQAYFTTTLGRTATSTELANWSQKLADNNGNVWKSGLVATLAGDELTAITSGKTNAEIVSAM